MVYRRDKGDTECSKPSAVSPVVLSLMVHSFEWLNRVSTTEKNHSRNHDGQPSNDSTLITEKNWSNNHSQPITGWLATPISAFSPEQTLGLNCRTVIRSQ